MRKVTPQREYAPTRTAFRLRRLLRDKGFQKFATVWAPLLLVAVGAGWVASQSDLRHAAMSKIDELKREALDRPEFAITKLEIEGADPDVATALRRHLSYGVGASSLTFDAVRARRRAQALGPVASAQVRLEAPSTLHITVTQREPALIWRHDGALTLLDREGAPIERVSARADYPDLPLVAGLGADRNAAAREALALYASSGPLKQRLRGLVRVGERRWNAVLDKGPVVMLPAKGALNALSYVTSLESGAERPLEKDVTAIDLRIPDRPTFRLGGDALQSLQDGRAAKVDGTDA